MKTLSRSEIRYILLREYTILEFGDRMSPGEKNSGESNDSKNNSTGNNNNNNAKGSSTDIAAMTGIESFDIKIDKKKISKNLKSFFKRVRRNSVKMVKNPRKFFNSQAGKNFEAILETSGAIILELAKKSANPYLAGAGLTFLVAGMIIDIVQNDMVGLFANVCLLTPGFAELAKSGAYGNKVKNAKGVTNLVNALKTEAQGGNKFLRSIVASGIGISQQTNTANVSKAIYSDKKIQKMNNEQLKRSAGIVQTISKFVGLPEAQQTMTTLKKRINAQMITNNKVADKATSTNEKEEVNEVTITRKQLRKLISEAVI